MVAFTLPRCLAALALAITTCQALPRGLSLRSSAVNFNSSNVPTCIRDDCAAMGPHDTTMILPIPAKATATSTSTSMSKAPTVTGVLIYPKMIPHWNSNATAVYKRGISSMRHQVAHPNKTTSASTSETSTATAITFSTCLPGFACFVPRQRTQTTSTTTSAFASDTSTATDVPTFVCSPGLDCFLTHQRTYTASAAKPTITMALASERKNNTETPRYRFKYRRFVDGTGPAREPQ